MADHAISTNLEPDAKATTPRKSGDPMTPEGAGSGHAAPAGNRSGAVTGSPEVIGNIAGPKSGQPMDNTMKPKFVARVITRATPTDPNISGIPK